MLGKSLLLLSAVALAAVSASAEARSDAIADGSKARKDLNSHAYDYGYHPGRRSFYNYPRHRHINGGGERGNSFGLPVDGSHDGSPNYDGNYGSPYFGINYGAPYNGGGYYDGGVYYRQRRD